MKDMSTQEQLDNGESARRQAALEAAELAANDERIATVTVSIVAMATAQTTAVANLAV